MRFVDHIRHPVGFVFRGRNIFSPCFVDMNLSRASFPKLDLHRLIFRPAKPVCSLERCLSWLFSCEDAFLDAVLFPQYKISHIAHQKHPGEIITLLLFSFIIYKCFSFYVLVWWKMMDQLGYPCSPSRPPKAYYWPGSRSNASLKSWQSVSIRWDASITASIGS